jgi:hypothetical protein
MDRWTSQERADVEKVNVGPRRRCRLVRLTTTYGERVKVEYEIWYAVDGKDGISGHISSGDDTKDPIDKAQESFKRFVHNARIFIFGMDYKKDLGL